jgi:oligoendopeptidase F
MKRTFLPATFKVTTWEALKPYFDKLLNRGINSKDELIQWFKDSSELGAVVSEDMAWRYIKMTCDTENESIRDHFNDFVQNIQPKIAPISDALNKKIVENKFLKDLQKQPGYDIMIREIQKEIELFREENIPLFTDMQTESQKYGQISGAMTIELNGDELTMQQAAVELQNTDREHREKVFHLISERRLNDRQELDKLFNKLISIRHNIATNAGFANYRDYKFKAMGRFDYTAEDCFAMHDSIEFEIVPILKELAKNRKSQLKVDTLKPWDKAVDPQGKSALKAFETGEDLLKRSIACFNRIDPYFGACLKTMEKMGHLDLVSRKGKAPGGYNYPLAESGVPFIFMNSTSTLRDMVTLMHEGGHAIHAFLADKLELNDFKNTPSEVAELASMSMELISMDAWDEFFDNEEDLKRAKREHLEQLIETLPWVATIDKFQHWIYENPSHSQEDRKTAWEEIFISFSDSITNWDGLDVNKSYLWQKQLHLYEVPFYYIEYGMAQLGAVAIWKNYKQDKQKGLDGYKAALKLGYTKSIPAIYKAANIKFDFSKDYIKELMVFVKSELDSI